MQACHPALEADLDRYVRRRKDQSQDSLLATAYFLDLRMTELVWLIAVLLSPDDRCR